MKYFIVLALCLSAVAAEELHERGVDFHSLHYSQHHQTVDEAKRKISDILDGQHAEFEEVGSYGGLGGVGVGTVGLSSSGLSSAGYGLSSGSNAEHISSAASNLGLSHSSNFASSSSYGSNGNFASDTYGSGGLHSGTQGGSSLLIPVLGGSGSTSYMENSAAGNLQQIVPEIVASGSVGGHESFVHHKGHLNDNQVATPLVYSSPSSGLGKYYRHEERRVSNSATPVLYTVPSPSGSENYSLQEYRAKTPHLIECGYRPSDVSEKYVHNKEEHIQQTPSQMFVTSPAGGQESYMKYRKVTTTASQPQVFVHSAPFTSSTYLHQSSSDSTSGSQLGQLVTGGLTGTNSNYKTGYYGNSAYTVPSTSFGSTTLTSNNGNSLYKSGFDTSNQATSTFGADVGANRDFTDSSSYGSKFGSQSKYGSTFGSESKFGSQLGVDSSFGSVSSFGASGSTSGLHNYMRESERLAKAQVQGMSNGGSRAGGSQLNANLVSGNTLGYGGFDGLSGIGAGNAGYKTKSWEKASKWSSQSEFGSDGQVNNYKELSTGESENFDINGRRTGYKAATTTLDDNGKVSTYSLHT